MLFVTLVVGKTGVVCNAACGEDRCCFTPICFFLTTEERIYEFFEGEGGSGEQEFFKGGGLGS